MKKKLVMEQSRMARFDNFKRSSMGTESRVSCFLRVLKFRPSNRQHGIFFFKGPLSAKLEDLV